MQIGSESVVRRAPDEIPEFVPADPAFLFWVHQYVANSKATHRVESGYTNIVRVATLNESFNLPILFARCIHRYVRRDEIDMGIPKHREHAIKMIPVDSCPIEIHLAAPCPHRDVFERALLFTPVVENEVEIADGGASSPAQ